MNKRSCLLPSLVLLAAFGPGRATGAEPTTFPGPDFASRQLRLPEIAVHRYVPATTGVVLERRYLLDARNRLTHIEDVNVPAAVTIPEQAFNQVLIMGAAWSAYRQLGPQALSNFELTTEIPILIADRMQYAVRVSAEARFDAGRLINVSTRGLVTPGEKLIAGFVVTEQSRRVLIRAVGPTLAALGVGGTMADPFVTLFKGRTPMFFNGDWSARFDAAEIAAAAAATGAFPLPVGSKDSAFVIELEPGTYTVQVEAETGGGGVALVEVYSVP